MDREGGGARVVRYGKLTEEQVAALEGARLFGPEDLNAAIVAVREVDGGAIAVYDYHLLCDLVFNDSCDGGYERAMEYVDYNMVRAIPYMGHRAPVVCMVIRRLDGRGYSDAMMALDREEYGTDVEIFMIEDAVYLML